MSSATLDSKPGLSGSLLATFPMGQFYTAPKSISSLRPGQTLRVPLGAFKAWALRALD